MHQIYSHPQICGSQRRHLGGGLEGAVAPQGKRKKEKRKKKRKKKKKKKKKERWEL